MTEPEFESFHATFVGIVEELDLLKEIAAVTNSSDPLPDNGGQEMAELLTNMAVEVERTTAGARWSSAVSSRTFRRRRRKQGKQKISRLDVAKGEEEEIFEELKKEECRLFLRSFRAVLPNFTPDDAVLRESDCLEWHLEVCKRLAGRVGRFMREKDGELAAQCAKIEELEENIAKEGKLKEELMEEVVELDKKLEDVIAVALEGAETDCSYCSINSGELKEQKNQKMSDIALKYPETGPLDSYNRVANSDTKIVPKNQTLEEFPIEGMWASHPSEMPLQILPLKPLRKELDSLFEEIEFVNIKTNLTKSDDLSIVNERSHNSMSCMGSKSSFVISECQKLSKVTKVFVQRETKNSVEETRENEIDSKLVGVNVEIENECKNGPGKGIQDENCVVESKTYQRNISYVNIVEELHQSDESNANISSVNVVEELNQSDEYCEETSFDANYLTKLLELENEYDFLEIKCCCTSLENVDTVGTLRIYKSGLLEIYCECMRDCNQGKSMSPAAFVIHGGHGVSMKWKDSIWILAGHKKVQLLKSKMLKPYCEMYEEMENLKTCSQTCQTGASIPDIEFLEKTRLRLRKRKDCDTHCSSLGIEEQKSSEVPYDRDGNFSNREKHSCFTRGQDSQNPNVGYNLRTRSALKRARCFVEVNTIEDQV